MFPLLPLLFMPIAASGARVGQSALADAAFDALTSHDWKVREYRQRGLDKPLEISLPGAACPTLLFERVARDGLDTVRLVAKAEPAERAPLLNASGSQSDGQERVSSSVVLSKAVRSVGPGGQIFAATPELETFGFGGVPNVEAFSIGLLSLHVSLFREGAPELEKQVLASRGLHQGLGHAAADASGGSTDAAKPVLAVGDPPLQPGSDALAPSSARPPAEADVPPASGALAPDSWAKVPPAAAKSVGKQAAKAGRRPMKRLASWEQIDMERREANQKAGVVLTPELMARKRGPSWGFPEEHRKATRLEAHRKPPPRYAQAEGSRSRASEEWLQATRDGKTFAGAGVPGRVPSIESDATDTMFLDQIYEDIRGLRQADIADLRLPSPADYLGKAQRPIEIDLGNDTADAGGAFSGAAFAAAHAAMAGGAAIAGLAPGFPGGAARMGEEGGSAEHAIEILETPGESADRAIAIDETDEEDGKPRARVLKRPSAAVQVSPAAAGPRQKGGEAAGRSSARPAQLAKAPALKAQLQKELVISAEDMQLEGSGSYYFALRGKELWWYIYLGGPAYLEVVLEPRVR